MWHVTLTTPGRRRRVGTTDTVIVRSVGRSDVGGEEITALGRHLARHRDRPLVMAIINRTPDSFYDRGATFGERAAFAAVNEAVAGGADIVDIGGVKAGPGAEVDPAEEIRRVVPFVAAVRERHPSLLLSVDTWRSEVARLACAEGADLINDTWAGVDPSMGAVAAEFQVGVVCSHTGGVQPRMRPHRVRYANLVSDVVAELTAKAETMVREGVPKDGILIDPTHDFGKNTWQSLELMRHGARFVDTGWPVLMALSHKDFIGETLGVDLGGRLEGTLAATAVAAWHGARVFRAHDVIATRRVCDMVASIAGRRLPTRTVRGLA